MYVYSVRIRTLGEDVKSTPKLKECEWRKITLFLLDEVIVNGYRRVTSMTLVRIR